MTFEEFLNLLENPQSKGYDRYMASCPAHEDRIASLSIRDGEDRILLYCHAGCQVASITDELGISMKDLFYDQEDKDLGEVVESYQYTDEEGNALYEKLRFEPKRFDYLQNGGTWGRGEKKVLYNLF